MSVSDFLRFFVVDFPDADGLLLDLLSILYF